MKTGLKPQLSKIDPKKDWFIANGNKYYIQDDVAMGRYSMYQKLRHITAFGVAPEDHIKFIDFVIKMLSGPLTGNTIHKTLENAYNVKDRYKSFVDDDIEPWFRFGALFVNREGEDISVWDEIVVKSKINDWMTEGISTNDFFLLIARQSPDLRIKLIESRPDILLAAAEEE